jgi:hypothetical protein
VSYPDAVYNLRDFAPDGVNIGDGVQDATDAISAWAKAGAGKSMYAPQPDASYRMTRVVRIAANSYVYGDGRLLTIFSKGADTDMFEMASGAQLKDLGLRGNGAKYRGRGIVISAGVEQSLSDCDVRDMSGYCVEFTQPGAGGESKISGGLYIRTDYTSDLYAIKCPENESLSHPGTTRYFDRLLGGGSQLVDFADVGDAWLTESFPRNVRFGRNAAIVNMANCRVASLGEPLYIDGGGHVIHGNSIAGPVIFVGNGLAGGGTSYADNNHTSLFAPNAKYCAIDHRTQLTSSELALTSGTIRAGSNKLILADRNGFFVSQWITVEGAGRDGRELRTIVVGLGVQDAVFLLHAASASAIHARVAGSSTIAADGVETLNVTTKIGSPLIQLSTELEQAPGRPILVQNADRSGLNFLSWIVEASGLTARLAHTMERSLDETGAVLFGPALNLGSDGHLRLAYSRRGDECHVNFDLLVGSDARLGNGKAAWRFLLPYMAYPSQVVHRFSLLATDVSTSTEYACHGAIDPGTAMPSLVTAGGRTSVHSGEPFSWGKGDSLRGEFTYAVH